MHGFVLLYTVRAAARIVDKSVFDVVAEQVRLYYGTRNWWITLNAVHDIHLHTLL